MTVQTFHNCSCGPQATAWSRRTIPRSPSPKTITPVSYSHRRQVLSVRLGSDNPVYVALGLNRSTGDSYTCCLGHIAIMCFCMLPVYQCCVARFRERVSHAKDPDHCHPWHACDLHSCILGEPQCGRKARESRSMCRCAETPPYRVGGGHQSPMV